MRGTGGVRGDDGLVRSVRIGEVEVGRSGVEITVISGGSVTFVFD